MPPLGAVDPPLAKKNKLIIGCGDIGRRITFRYRENRDCDFLYLKIFVTRERTDFKFLLQWFTSPTEDRLRGESWGQSLRQIGR